MELCDERLAPVRGGTAPARPGGVPPGRAGAPHSRGQRAGGSDAVKRSKPAWKAVPRGSVAL